MRVPGMLIRTIVLSLVGGAALSIASPAPVAAAVAQADWRKIKPTPPRPFNPQQPKRIQLDNGLVIFLQEDRELPLISLSAVVRGGSAEEPAEKTGLTDVLGSVWRTGGTKARTGDQIDDFLGLRAATVETDSDEDSLSLSANFLKTDFDEVFKLIVEILREPEFRQDKIDLAKKQIYTGISRRNDNPQEIIAREAGKLAFGREHPRARQSEYTTVGAVTREDLLSWHKRTVHPNNMYLGLSGDFDVREMEAKLRAALGGWPKGPAQNRPKLSYTPTKSGLFFVAKEDVNQSSIQLVQLGTTNKNPDVYALDVMNEILGGGFSARLFSNVRSKKGLAYNVRGGVGMGWDDPDIYRLSMGTASKNTRAAIEALLEEVNGMLKNQPTELELARAKDSLLNSFVFKFDSKAKILRDRMNLEFYGYPPDWTTQYYANIQKVTLDDVKRVAQKYLNPGGFAIIVVGNPAEVGDQLKQMQALGTVQELDISIPPLPKVPSVPAPTQRPPASPAPTQRPPAPR
jgi:zinc protease